MFAGNTTNSLKATDVKEAAVNLSNDLTVHGYPAVGINGTGSFSPDVVVPTVTGVPQDYSTLDVITVPFPPAPYVFVPTPEPIYPADLVPAEPTSELQDLKDQINSSFEEVASLLGGLAAAIEDLEGRIARHNGRSSHKI